MRAREESFGILIERIIRAIKKRASQILFSPIQNELSEAAHAGGQEPAGWAIERQRPVTIPMLIGIAGLEFDSTCVLG